MDSSDIVPMPFAVDSWSAGAIRVGRRADGAADVDAPFPCVALVRASRTALTLNNTAYDLDGAPDLSETGGSEALYLQELIKRQCRPWDQAAQRFVEAYFGAIQRLLAQHADEVAQRLAPFAGLYDATHFVYSAPRPFPRAHLYAPAGTAADKLVPDDFVMVDFAFVLGPEVVAMLAAQSGLTPRKARERLERLQHAGVRTEIYAAADLAEDKATALFTRALAPRLPAYWSDDPVPVGPFRPAGLEL
jgi:hypothetical protein